jgi:hypothetical protein
LAVDPTNQTLKSQLQTSIAALGDYNATIGGLVLDNSKLEKDKLALATNLTDYFAGINDKAIAVTGSIKQKYDELVKTMPSIPLYVTYPPTNDTTLKGLKDNLIPFNNTTYTSTLNVAGASTVVANIGSNTDTTKPKGKLIDFSQYYQASVGREWHSDCHCQCSCCETAFG